MINLKKIEKDSFAAFHHEHGLFDILLGLVFLWVSLGILFDFDTGPVLIIVILAISIAVKKHVILPRIGHVKFGKKREKSMAHVIMLLSFSVLMGTGILALSKLDIISGKVHIGAIIFPINILVVFGLMAWFLDYNRLYWYAMLLSGSVAGFEITKAVLGINTGAYYIVGASLIIKLIGIKCFMKFLKKYPLPKQGA